MHQDAFGFQWTGIVIHDWHCHSSYPFSASEMTYIVSSGVLKSTHSTHSSYPSTRPFPSHLRSAQNGDYSISRTLTGFNWRSFSVAGPDAWNSHPRVIRCIIVPSTFKHRLKTELFSRANNISLDISDNQTVTYVYWLIDWFLTDTNTGCCYPLPLVRHHINWQTWPKPNHFLRSHSSQFLITFQAQEYDWLIDWLIGV